MTIGPDGGGEDVPHPTAATPNREGRRESAIIDAKAEEVASATEAPAQQSADESPATPDEPEPESPAPMPRPLRGISVQRVLLWVAVALGGFALLIAVGVGAHLFVTTDGAIVDLRAHATRLDQKTATVAGAADLAALGARVAALETQLKATTASVAALQGDAEKEGAVTSGPAPTPVPPVDLTPLEQRITALEARLVPLAAAVAASKVDVSTDQDNLRQAVSASNAAALVVVGQSLLGALDRGAPFASEVAAAATLGADPDRIAVLQPVADKGVPTAAVLAESFAPLAAPILTGTGSKEPQSILDRLERGASSLVRVRPVGEATGNDPAALVARIEGALGRGDVAAAVSAWDQLPAAAKTVTGEWGSEARARVAADAAAQAILSAAIDRLGRSKS